MDMLPAQHEEFEGGPGQGEEEEEDQTEKEPSRPSSPFLRVVGVAEPGDQEPVEASQPEHSQSHRCRLGQDELGMFTQNARQGFLQIVSEEEKIFHLKRLGSTAHLRKWLGDSP
jgi:hypothetical protein